MTDDGTAYASSPEPWMTRGLCSQIDSGLFYPPRGGGHCRGGDYGGCCQTFASDRAFIAHRTGPMDARTCLPVLRSEHWRIVAGGWTNSPPLNSDALERITGKVGR